MAASPPAVYDALAFSTQVAVGGVIDSGATFPEGLGCTTASGVSRTNGGAVSVPGFVSAGASTNTVSTIAVGAVQQETSTSQLLGVELLNDLIPGGLISADALAISTTATSAADGTVSSTGSVTVTNLRVGLTVLNGSIAPNTGISVPGIGTLTINRQIPVPGNVGLVTIGLSLDISLGLDAGTSVTVGYTHAFYRPPTPVIISGVAYSNLLSAGPLSVGPVAATGVPCTGGTSTSTALGVNIPGVISTGAVTVTGQATVGETTTGSTTSTVAGVNLLNGAVTASAITAQANATYAGGVTTFDATGTTIADLAIGGVPYLGPVTPGTPIPVPGVGVLYINRQIADPSSLSVRALELVLTGPQIVPGGTLPTYSVIQVGGAIINAASDGQVALSTQLDQADTISRICADQADPVACLT
ncbi:hypothetical protein MXD63_24785 [Frankia sp. Cpl3]|nr:hypothetical protein [Frankia sp. Cpl3]